MPGKHARAGSTPGDTRYGRVGFLVLVASLLIGGVAVAAIRLRGSGSAEGAAPPSHSRTTPRSTPATATPAPASVTPSPAPYSPPPIKPIIHPAVQGEGVWHPAQKWAPGGSPVQLATYRPNKGDPSVRAYVAWIDATRTELGLYPGTENPPSAPSVPRGPMVIPQGARAHVLAAFNGGFFLTGPPGFQQGLTTPGGFFVNGNVYSPMVKGLATVVAYTDGTVDVTKWEGGRAPGSNVVFARQNFPLMVQNGKPNPTVGDNAAWGITLGGTPAIWRTAIGVDAHGNLMYVAASAQTAASLAQILIHVGCVRAMQLDINPEWPIFNVYGKPGAGAPRMFVPNPNQSAARYLYPGTNKDFFAVYVRTTPRYKREPF